MINGGAGAVGSSAVQIAVARGARVIGTASPGNHGYLRSLGAEPTTYGEGVAERLRELAPDGVDAAVDAAGGGEAAARPISTLASSQVSRTAARAQRASLGPSDSVPDSTHQATRSGGSMAPPGKT